MTAVEKARDLRLKRLYGITLEQYRRALLLQKGMCSICQGKASKGNRLFVDHDHGITKRVRGILCYLCNRRLIGRWKAGDADLFRRAADYLASDFDIRSL